jgi:hypothetical protein
MFGLGAQELVLLGVLGLGMVLVFVAVLRAVWRDALNSPRDD